MNRKRRLILSSLLASAPIFAAAHPEGGDFSRYVSQKLAVGGRVTTALDLSVNELTNFPVQLPADIPIIGHTGDILRTLKGYEGARLTDILDKSVLLATDQNDLKRTVIVATASDDYKAVFSWNELYNTSVGEGVLVLYGKGGKPLDEDEGRISLISTKDIHTGARHVRWLKNIQVQKIT